MLEVPSPSYAGESIELSCIYELEQDKLYSVKWYKNDVEFYRCEVSAEAPSFVTAEGEKELQVTGKALLPSSGPQIIGVQPSYKVGDEGSLNLKSFHVSCLACS
ncbi:hypothetical protein BLA29_002926 [Euroglyphus maynei]|uniref:Ig-like domain-containing protein n=1 Tax=Euroglyphus maynei TaxID=6958 RepID=A0A1Y3BDW0_EURMA|nr:hypothetical protein BLA29_002926 [Euroglyphus maynei]